MYPTLGTVHVERPLLGERRASARKRHDGTRPAARTELTRQEAKQRFVLGTPPMLARSLDLRVKILGEHPRVATTLQTVDCTVDDVNDSVS